MTDLLQILKKHENTLEKIDQNIKTITQTHHTTINSAVSDLINGGGKKLRPLLLILSAKFGNEKCEKYKLGAAIEILHMATLVHDDIIDDAEKRRGNKSAQSKFGNNAAVFIGDFLLSRVFNIFIQYSSKKPMFKLSKIVKQICEGEINQFQNKYNTDISLKQYFKRIRKKTALLFGFSTYLGAYESGLRKKDLYNLYNTGLNFGMAFQIQDDILDFQGQEKLMGKEIGQDINSGIYTLPLVFLLKKDIESINKLLLKDELDKEDLEYIIKKVKKNGIKPSKNIMLKFLQKANQYLHKLPEIKAKHELQEIINYQYYRNF